MHICMLAYTFYEGDNRVRRYAETFARKGDTVDAIILRQNNAKHCERYLNVNLYKIQKRDISEKHQFDYLLKLMLFFVKSMFCVTYLHLKKPYDVIHVHSIPDFEVFATIIAKLLGSRIILDIHDIVPELFLSKFNVSKKSFLYKALIAIEKMSTQYADHVIIANHIWYQRIVGRSVNADKCSVVMNYPDNIIFNNNNVKPQVNRSSFTLVYPGTLSIHQGIETAIRAVSIVKEDIPDIQFLIYGKGTDEVYFKKLTEDLNLNTTVIFNNIVPLQDLPQIIRNADIGIEPKSKTFFSNEAFSTKILEFMIMGIPVIASDTLVHRYYFNDNQIMFFESDNPVDCARCIKALKDHKSMRNKLISHANAYMKFNNWDKQKHKYISIVNKLNT